MSADNWSICPRCTEAERQDIAEMESQINADYGKVSIEVFEQRRHDLAKRKEQFEKEIEARGEGLRATFREDYEIYGAHEGLFYIKYSGECQKCDLNFKFEYEQRFWEPGE